MRKTDVASFRPSCADPSSLGEVWVCTQANLVHESVETNNV